MSQVQMRDPWAEIEEYKRLRDDLQNKLREAYQKLGDLTTEVERQKIIIAALADAERKR